MPFGKYCREPIPGACSVIAALSVAGLPTNQFSFRGFAPTKAKDRTTFLRTMSEEPLTQVFFETPHRITDTIAAMSQLMPGRDVAVCRELTKKFEQVVFLGLKKFKKCLLLLKSQVRGEFVIIVRGVEIKKSTNDDLLLNILLTELSPFARCFCCFKVFFFV